MRRVPDTAARLKISPDGKAIDTSGVEFVVNPYEEYALEQGVQLKEKHGGEVTVLTLGPERSTPMIQKTLALGADNAIHLKSDNFPDDPNAVARALAAELKGHSFDVLLFGKKGVDDDNHQVGEMVSELLGIPCVTQVVKLEVKDGNATATREVEGGSIIVDAGLPAAFTSEKDLATPRYASLRELVAARKKPITIRQPQQFPGHMEVISLQNPPTRPPGRIIGRGVEAVPALVKVLHEEAKVI